MLCLVGQGFGAFADSRSNGGNSDSGKVKKSPAREMHLIQCFEGEVLSTAAECPAPTITAGGPLTFCPGGNVTLTATSVAADAYIWSNGETTQTITAATPGSYTVQTVTAGCTSDPSEPVVVAFSGTPAKPTLSANGPTTFCNGGTVEIVASGTADAFLWNTGMLTDRFFTFSPGTFYARAIVNGCLSEPSDSIVVTVKAFFATPTTSPAGHASICGGGPLTIRSSRPNGNRWSNGDTTQSITVSAAGSYSVFVVTGECTSQTSIPVTVGMGITPEIPVATATGPTNFCSGNYLGLSASMPPSTIEHYISNQAGGNIAWSTAADNAGNVYIMYRDQQLLKKMTPDGTVTNFAGGSQGAANGQGSAAKFNFPYGIATDKDGFIYISDTYNYRIRKVSPSGLVSTLTAPLDSISGYGLAVDKLGNIIVAEYKPEMNRSRICKVSPTGVITVLAGSTPGFADGPAATAKFDGPMDLDIDSAGNIYVSDYNNHKIRKIGSNGIVTTVAGSGAIGSTDGFGSTASFDNPTGVAMGPKGYVYIADLNTNKVRKMSPDGNVSTIALYFSGQPYMPIAPYGITGYDSSHIFISHRLGVSKIEVHDQPEDYIWSDGQRGAFIVIGSSGNYSVRAVANGCTSAASAAVPVTVRQAPPQPGMSISGGTTVCSGGFSILGSSEPFGNHWSNGDTTQYIRVTEAGDYTVYITGNGCTGPVSNPIHITLKPTPVTPVLTASGSLELCDGEDVTLFSSAATGNFWNNGLTLPSITVSRAGVYTVRTVSDDCTSAASNSMVVTVRPLPNAPTVTASGPISFCPGGSVTLTSSAPFRNLWSNGDTTQSVTVSSGGDYSVRLVSGRCTSAASAAISVNAIAPQLPVISASAPLALCGGGSLTLNSSAAFGNLWSTGDTAQSITVAVSGTYTVQQTLNGCTSAQAEAVVVTVTTPPIPVITASGSFTFCDGDSITLTSDVVYGSIWSTGETTRTITVKTPGDYSVMAFVSACTGEVSQPVTVNVNPRPATPAVTASGPLSFCSGGSITLTSSEPDSNLWSNGELTQSITVTESGNYSVQRLGARCVSYASETFNVLVTPMPAKPVVTVTGPVTICEGSNVTLSTSAASGIRWNTGDTTQSITVSAAGKYTVTSTSGACTSPASDTVTIYSSPLPATPTISAIDDLAMCQGGSVRLSSSIAGAYLWSSGQTTRILTVTVPGNYSVRTINGTCTSLASMPVTVTTAPVPPTPTIRTSGPTSFCTGGSVTLTSSVATGNVWYTGETTQSITVTTSGDYGVFVVYGTCTSDGGAEVIVTVNNTPATPVISAAGPADICAGSSIVLTSSAASGNIWSTGANTQSITVSVAGDYTVKQVVGRCTSALSVVKTVTVSPLPATPVVTALGSTAFCPGGSVTLQSSAATGNLWSSGDTTQSITVSAAGSYTVKAVSGQCSSAASSSVSVTVFPAPVQPVITAGAGTLDAGPGGASYQWYRDGVLIPGINVRNIDTPDPGSYTVSYTDANGCTSVLSAPYLVVGTLLKHIVQALQLVPNPTDNFVSIAGLEAKARVVIYSMLGQVVFDRDAEPGTELDLQHLPAGVYEVRVNGRALRLVKNR
ncbi:MAG: T9SS type A sorting domain-containing protein [Bacteroidota bacterium]